MIVTLCIQLFCNTLSILTKEESNFGISPNSCIATSLKAMQETILKHYFKLLFRAFSVLFVQEQTCSFCSLVTKNVEWRMITEMFLQTGISSASRPHMYYLILQ